MKNYSKQNPLLMIPGPAMVPQKVMNAIANPVIPHRSVEFSYILEEVYSNLKYIFQTNQDVFVFPSSGTGAMCSALENLINKGDRVLSLVCGVFGRRWVQIAQNCGADVSIIEVSEGKSVDVEKVEDYLSKNPTIKIVTLTHSETSTGAANDVKTICSVIKKYGALSVVDGISSVGVMNCKMDEWGIDVLVSASQKGFMCPPGLSFLAASESAMNVYRMCGIKSYYFNWDFYKNAVKNNSVPYTPAINLIAGLKVALEIMNNEGLENIVKRHEMLSHYLRKNLKIMGLNLLAGEKNSSSAVTAVIKPEGYSVEYIRNQLKENYNIIVADGQENLKSKIFRIGTIGLIEKEDVDYMLKSLKEVLIS